MKTPTTTPAPTPNMTREYKKELRALEREMKKANRDRSHMYHRLDRDIARIETCASQDIRSLRREAAKRDKGTLKQIAAYEKRHAILIGRLS